MARRRWTPLVSLGRWPPICGRRSSSPPVRRACVLRGRGRGDGFPAGRAVRQAKAKRSAGAALRALLSLGAKSAVVLRGDLEVGFRSRSFGSAIWLWCGQASGSQTDGVVIEGRSDLDMSAMTGESVPVDVGPAMRCWVVRSTFGRIILRANRVGADAAVANGADGRRRARTARRPATATGGQRVSGVRPCGAGHRGGNAVGGWLLAGHSAADAFTAAVAVLIIACPCALGLATPDGDFGGHRSRGAAGRADQGAAGAGETVRGSTQSSSTRRAP